MLTGKGNKRCQERSDRGKFHLITKEYDKQSVMEHFEEQLGVKISD